MALKICKECGAEVSSKGICPKCGKDQRNFFVKHKFITFLLVVIVLGAVVGASGSGNNKNQSTPVTANETSTDSDTTVKENTIEELSNQYKIMQLQKDYDSGVVKEEELSSYEKDRLMELYKKQVETLEINIAIKQQELLSYKEKILKAKQKLSLN